MLGEGCDQSLVSTGMWKAADGHFSCTSACVASKESAFLGTSVARHIQDHWEGSHIKTMAPCTRCVLDLNVVLLQFVPWPSRV